MERKSNPPPSAEDTAITLMPLVHDLAELRNAFMRVDVQVSALAARYRVEVPTINP